MKKWLFLCAFFAAAALWGEESLWIVPIRGDIDPAQVAFVRREARKAVNSGANILVFEIDTFGGRVDSALQITSFISTLRLPTAAWVRSGEHSMGVSWSAGALIAFACKEIYMAAGTSMGAAAPVVGGADGQMEGAGEKTVAAVRSQIAALAERNKHPVGIALAMVDYDIELWEVKTGEKIEALTPDEAGRREMDAVEAGTAPAVRVKQICAPGKLLSFTAGEAYRYGLAAGIVENTEELCAALGATIVSAESKAGFSDSLVALLTSSAIRSLLIIIGIAMIFLEVNTPGFGLPGTAAIIAFALVFGSSALVGTVDSLEIILFLVGIALLAVEIFILPGFGIIGIAGILIIGIALILSMQDFVIPRSDWELTVFGRNAAAVGIGILGATAGIALLVLLGPKIQLFNRLTLNTAITGTDSEPHSDLLGKTGTAASTLRPAGKAAIDGRIYSVESEGEFIEQGTGIRVAQVAGNRITVNSLKSLSQAEVLHS
ncbi:serine protease [Spirochaetia bacterium]|nr:serine protease [Spirochaetia bacterium]